MKCPFCTSKTQVYNSRSSHQKTQTWRRRQCLVCKKAFTTRERVDFNAVVTIKNIDEASPYSRERLLLSVVRASDKLILPPGILTELVDSIEIELQQSGFFNRIEQSTETITQITTRVLQRYNKNLALLYVTAVYKNQPPGDLMRELLASS